MNIILNIIFVIILFISGGIRILQSKNFDFPFTYDQARDMLDLRVLGNFVDFRVSGPTTSITGLNLGPFYYIFNLPAYWIGNGNPQTLVTWNILWFLVSGLVIYIFFYKKDRVLGLAISAIYLMSPQLFPITRYFWNANSVVYFIVFYYLAFWKYAEDSSTKNTLLWGITAGLVIQFEAAFGSACVLFSLLYVLGSLNTHKFKWFLVGLIPWFTPQIIYEVTHKFRMSNLLIGFFTGANPVIGDKIALVDTISLHWKTISVFFEGQFMLPWAVGLGLLILAVFVPLVNKTYRKQTFALLTFILFIFIYFTLIYRHELKPWYLEGIRVWYIFIVGIAFSLLLKTRKILMFLVVLFVTRSIILTAIDQSRYVEDNAHSNDPKNASNIIQAIDWQYSNANGRPFEAYNFVPETYDFPQQYLYWWYGNKKYKYIPNKISYSLAPVPRYIRGEQSFTKESVKTTDEIALIYETKNGYHEWLNQFNHYCLLNKQEFDWNMTVEWRKTCQ